MVIALETFWPSSDGWSAARIEEQLVVTKDGCEVITRFPAEELWSRGPLPLAGGALPLGQETPSRTVTATAASRAALPGRPPPGPHPGARRCVPCEAVYRGKRDLGSRTCPAAGGPGRARCWRCTRSASAGPTPAEWEHGPSIYSVPGPHPVTGHHRPADPGSRALGARRRDRPRRRRLRAAAPSSRAARATSHDGGGGAARPNLSWHLRDGRAAAARRPRPVRGRPRGDLHSTSALRALADDAARARPTAGHRRRIRCAKGRLRPGEHALVIGAGGIGVFLLYAAVELGARVTSPTSPRARLGIAPRLGAETCSTPAQAAAAGAPRDARDPSRRSCFEVTGSEAGPARRSSPPDPDGARVVLTGLHEHPREIDLRRVTLGRSSCIGTNAHVCDVDLPEAVRRAVDPASRAGPTRARGLSARAPARGGDPAARRAPATRIKTLIDPWAVAPRDALTGSVER